MTKTNNSLAEPLKSEQRILRRYIRKLKRERSRPIGFFEATVQRGFGILDSKNGRPPMWSS